MQIKIRLLVLCIFCILNLDHSFSNDGKVPAKKVKKKPEFEEVEYVFIRENEENFLKSTIDSCKHSNLEKKAEIIEKASYEDFKKLSEKWMASCPNPKGFIDHTNKLEKLLLRRFTEFWNVLEPNLRDDLLIGLKNEKERQKNNELSLMWMVREVFRKNSETGSRYIIDHFEKHNKGPIDELLLIYADEFTIAYYQYSVHLKACVEYMSPNDPKKCYSQNIFKVKASDIVTDDRWESDSAQEQKIDDETSAVEPKEDINDDGSDEENIEGENKDSDYESNIEIEGKTADVGRGGAPLVEDLELSPGIEVKGTFLKGWGLLGKAMKALGINVRIGIDLTTNDEQIVDSVPDNITVNAPKGDFYNLDLHAGEIKKVCSKSGKEIIQIEGLEDVNLISLQILSPEIIRLLNCLSNSSEGAVDVIKGILQCIESPINCGMDTIESLAEFFMKLDDIGALLDDVHTGVEELSELPTETKEKIICNMIGMAIVESGGGFAIAKALPKITKMIMTKIAILKKIARSKLNLTPDLLDIVSTMSEENLKKVDFLQDMASRDSAENLKQLNNKLEASLRSCMKR